MATTAKIAKEQKTPKFKVRLRNRCHLCGRPRAYMRKFGLCRLCFRKLALDGDVTGVTKSSCDNVLIESFDAPLIDGPCEPSTDRDHQMSR